jgi:hypothetical protein
MVLMWKFAETNPTLIKISFAAVIFLTGKPTGPQPAKNVDEDKFSSKKKLDNKSINRQLGSP